MSESLKLNLFPKEDWLVTVQEVAQACTISKVTVRALMEEGVLLVFAIGTSTNPERMHVRILRYSAEAWYVLREEQTNEVKPPYKLSPAAQWWLGELRKRKVGV